MNFSPGNWHRYSRERWDRVQMVVWAGRSFVEHERGERVTVEGAVFADRPPPKALPAPPT